MHETKERLKKWIPLLSVLPFFTGTVGYTLAGERLLDALYFSFSLYFVNLVSDASNPLIEAARWGAALVTTTAVLYALKRVWTRIQWAALCLHPDSVAVYCGQEDQVVFPGKRSGVLYPGREFRPGAKSHIILLETDAASLGFYEAHQKQLEKHRVYIALRELDRGFLRDVPGVVFFDINGAIARLLWKSIRLWQKKTNQFNIVIWGGGHLGQTILNYGLLLNLFSLEQQISYHLTGNTTLYQISHALFRPENGDTISFHDTDSDRAWEAVRQADLVILAEDASAERLQALRTACQTGTVYYYASSEGDEGAYLKFSRLFPFGADQEIYRDPYIRGETLVQAAKEQHYAYLNAETAAAETPDTAWQKLDGFTQWSNISSVDFQEVLRDLSGLELEVLAELEHIRWSRFYTLSGWRFGIPASGENRDIEEKIHKNLLPYKELPPSEKEKDRALIRRILGG